MSRSKLQPLAPEVIREEAEGIALHWVEYLDNGKSDFLHKAAIKEMTDDICKFIEGTNFASPPRFKDVEWKGNIAFCGKVEIGSIEYNPDTWIMFDYSGYEYEYQTEEEAKAAVESSWKEFTEKITK